MNFLKQDLLSMFFGNSYTLKFIDKQVVESSRWYTDYECVFRCEDTGHFYRVFYSVSDVDGSIEIRGSEGDSVECNQVILRWVVL